MALGALGDIGERCRARVVAVERYTLSAESLNRPGFDDEFDGKPPSLRGAGIARCAARREGDGAAGVTCAVDCVEIQDKPADAGIGAGFKSKVAAGIS